MSWPEKRAYSPSPKIQKKKRAPVFTDVDWVRPDGRGFQECRPSAENGSVSAKKKDESSDESDSESEELPPKVEEVEKPKSPIAFLTRLILGSLAGLYYVLVPIYTWLKNLVVPKDIPI